MNLSHQSKRTLSSIKLTRRFHFRFMGLWVAWTTCLVFVLNLLLYLYVEERWGGGVGRGTAQYQEYQFVLRGFISFMCIEMTLFVSAIIALAVTTAHRIAGPLIHLEAALKEVRDGNFDYRLHLRDYDHLEELELVFNQMVRAVSSSSPVADKEG